MSKCFRYDVIGADIDYHVKKHPQEDMRSLGFVLLNSEPCSVADCWFFEVDDSVDNFPNYVPPYLTEIRSDYFKSEYRPHPKTTKVIKCDDSIPIKPGEVVVTVTNENGTFYTKTLKGFVAKSIGGGPETCLIH